MKQKFTGILKIRELNYIQRSLNVFNFFFAKNNQKFVFKYKKKIIFVHNDFLFIKKTKKIKRKLSFKLPTSRLQFRERMNREGIDSERGEHRAPFFTAAKH